MIFANADPMSNSAQFKIMKSIPFSIYLCVMMGGFSASSFACPKVFAGPIAGSEFVFSRCTLVACAKRLACSR